MWWFKVLSLSFSLSLLSKTPLPPQFRGSGFTHSEAGWVTPALEKRSLSTFSSFERSVILDCSAEFSSSSSLTRCCVSNICTLFFSLLFRTATLFLSRFSRYSRVPLSNDFFLDFLVALPGAGRVPASGSEVGTIREPCSERLVMLVREWGSEIPFAADISAPFSESYMLIQELLTGRAVEGGGGGEQYLP